MSQRKQQQSGKPRSNQQPAAAPPPAKSMTSTYLRAFAFFMLAAAVILFAIVRLGDRDSDPATDSAEAGFARDMKTHHGQAVEMAFIVLERISGADTNLHFFLTDMIQTQINQMGQMEAWLNLWELPVGSVDPPMTWMGHSVTGLMPGMATQEEINELKTLPENEMVIRFMELMIVHHGSAVEMANALLERSDHPVVRRLAESIVRTQEAEISRMNLFIEEFGGTPGGSPGATPVASPEHDGGH